MKWLVFIVVLLSVTALTFVPSTADFALLLNDFERIKIVLPENTFHGELPKGFVCFFGKLSLNISTIFELFESEDFERLENAVQFSLVTDDPEWIEENLPEVAEKNEQIQNGDLFYFVSPSMVEDVKALIEGRLTALELNEAATIHGRLRGLPLIGIVLHLIGFNEGIPTEDELLVKIEDTVTDISLQSKKVCKSEWELTLLEKRKVPDGLKTLIDADVSVLLPISLLGQIPEELREEIGLEFEGLDEMIALANFISFSVSEEDQKLLISFDMDEEDVQKAVEVLEKAGFEAQNEGEFITIQFENAKMQIPRAGGICLLVSNVDEQDVIDVDPNTVVRFTLKMEGSILDVVLVRDTCSLIMNAKVSNGLLRDFLAEMLAEFQPKPEELTILENIAQTIDDYYYHARIEPPEDLQELKILLDEELPDGVFYSRTEEGGMFVVEIGIVTPLALTITEETIERFTGWDIDSVTIDREAQTISVIRTYEKLETPSASEILKDLVEGIRSYVADFGELPESLEDVLFWYTWLPYSLLDKMSYEFDEIEGTVTLKLATEEEVDEDFAETLSLEKLYREDGSIVVIFKIEGF